MPRTVIRALAAVIAASTMLMAPAPAAAKAPDEARWAVQPSGPNGPSGIRSQLVYDLAGGEQVTDWVGLSNLGESATTFEVYASDAFNASDGSFSLLTASQQPRDVGSWIALSKREFTVPPGKRLDIPFQLTVPPDAAPGDHVGGVIAASKVEQTTADGQRVLVERRIAVRVYLRVAGPVNPSATVTAVDVAYDNPLMPFGGADLTVTYRLRNTGNVRLTGSTAVNVDGPFGIGLGSGGAAAFPELLPGSEITLTRQVAGVFPAGPINTMVTVSAAATGGELSPVRRSITVWAVPWLLVLAVLFAAVAVVLVRVVRRRRAGVVVGARVTAALSG